VTQSPPLASALPRRSFAFKRAAGDRENGERAARCRADLLGGRRVEPQEHERSRIHEFVPSSENFRELRECLYIGPSGRRSPLATAARRLRNAYAGSRTVSWSESSRSRDQPLRRVRRPRSLPADRGVARTIASRRSAPSSVRSVARRSSSWTPSTRSSSQSALPPGRTVPRRRGPSKLSPLNGAV
jgi:hypothetical protein